MTIFARPGRALYDYENMLSRKPRSWPPTTHDTPTLWGRARALCADVIAFVRSAASLAKRWRLGRKERREILDRITPVEKLVGTLCLIEASTWLLTPEGRALRAATPQVVPPAPPPPTFVAKASHKTTIPYPGWHTIATRGVDPRIAEREARERAALEAARQSIAATKPAQAAESFSGLTRESFFVSPPAAAAAKKGSRPKPGTDSTRPDATQNNTRPPHGACGFPIIGWQHPTPETPPPPRPAKRRLFIALLAEDSTFDLTDDLAPIDTRRAKREDGPAAALARRIDALQRVLANPAPVIRRLIRFLASVPQDDLPRPWLARARSLRWWHGRPEAHNAINLLVPLMADVRATHPVRPQDPG